jgi:cation transport ATPase
MMSTERVFRRGLIIVALAALALGLAMWGLGHAAAARWVWALGTIPVATGLAASMTRDFLAGRIGVDAIALVSMSAALLLGETLAGIVVAVMYAGGNVLEDFAVARAERDLKSLVDRAPRVAHRRGERGVEDIAVEQVAVAEDILVSTGEIIPIDRIINGASGVRSTIRAHGGPIPVSRERTRLERHPQCRRDAELRATATAGAAPMRASCGW